MKRVFTKTFFRFLISFMAILAISCSLLILTSTEVASESAAVAKSLWP